MSEAIIVVATDSKKLMTRGGTTTKKESKKARERRRREKIKFCIFAALFVPASILGAELSLFKHPATSRGIIQSIDLPTHTLLLASTLKTEPISVTWVEDTEFFVEGIKSEPDKLQPQMKATVWTREPLVFPDKVLKISASAQKPVGTNGK